MANLILALFKGRKVMSIYETGVNFEEGISKQWSSKGEQ